MDDQSPFADVCVLAEGSFSIPELKWRELVFIGALRAESGAYLRDAARPMPPFERAGLFPEGVRFRVVRDQARVVISREASGATA